MVANAGKISCNIISSTKLGASHVVFEGVIQIGPLNSSKDFGKKAFHPVQTPSHKRNNRRKMGVLLSSFSIKVTFNPASRGSDFPSRW